MPINPEYKRARLIAARWLHDHGYKDAALAVEAEVAKTEQEIGWADETLADEAAEIVRRLREASKPGDIIKCLIELDEAAKAYATEVRATIPEADSIPAIPDEDDKPKGPNP